MRIWWKTLRSYLPLDRFKERVCWIWLIFWIFCGVAIAMTWTSKAGLGFLIGFFLSPFGFLFVLQRQEKTKLCPVCKMNIHPDSILCLDCERKADATSAAPTAKEKAARGRVERLADSLHRNEVA
jgi:hypothetical protein